MNDRIKKHQGLDMRLGNDGIPSKGLPIVAQSDCGLAPLRSFASSIF